MKRIVGLSLAFLLLLSSSAVAAERTAIAVAAEKDTPNSQVSTVAGRSPYFLLFDEKGAFLEAVSNPYQNARGGAGSAAADFLAAKGVKVIVAGTFGPRMVGAMQAKNLRHLEFKGSAADAVKQAIADSSP